MDFVILMLAMAWGAVSGFWDALTTGWTLAGPTFALVLLCLFRLNALSVAQEQNARQTQEILMRVKYGNAAVEND